MIVQSTRGWLPGALHQSKDILRPMSSPNVANQTMIFQQAYISQGDPTFEGLHCLRPARNSKPRKLEPYSPLAGCTQAERSRRQTKAGRGIEVGNHATLFVGRGL